MIDINKIYTSNNCGQFKVVNYVSAINVDVEFLKTGTRKNISAQNVRTGTVKDEYAPSVYGVGFVGVGEHKPTINKKQTKVYKAWKGMLERCYCHKFKARFPTYIDCTACHEWHNLQIFAEWFGDNYIDGYQIDKDIKIKGNKVYSPVTCIFVSPAENVAKATAKHYKFISPCGKVSCIYNLSEFCRENNLNKNIMYNVSKGKKAQHEGWSKF